MKIIELPELVLVNIIKSVLYSQPASATDLLHLLIANSRFKKVFYKCRRQIMKRWSAATFLQRKFRAIAYGGCLTDLTQTPLIAFILRRANAEPFTCREDQNGVLDLTRIKNRFLNSQWQIEGTDGRVCGLQTENLAQGLCFFLEADFDYVRHITLTTQDLCELKTIRLAAGDQVVWEKSNLGCFVGTKCFFVHFPICRFPMRDRRIDLVFGKAPPTDLVAHCRGVFLNVNAMNTLLGAASIVTKFSVAYSVV